MARLKGQPYAGHLRRTTGRDLMRNPVSSCLLAALMVLAVPPGSAAATQPFERTEQREPCAAYAPLRQPLYGDLHVHTRLSQDAYLSSQRNGPDEAYAYARGKDITLPDVDGDQTISARLRRPLDFTAVTDHGRSPRADSVRRSARHRVRREAARSPERSRSAARSSR
jgi:hypothetical protein